MWEGEQPVDDAAAALVFEHLYSKYLEDEWQTAPTPRIAVEGSTAEGWLSGLVVSFPVAPGGWTP
ncbi:hypothetical protein ACFFWC_31520 [Plantactinospora siamensis]|uniref:Uncharacterized protein n=1 Tax=Plantactinospora siamensis TaxID=555372 RepID=A0ABV6P551_9ACTN